VQFPLEASRGICTCQSYALLFFINGKGVHLLPVRASAGGDNGKRFSITEYYMETALNYFSDVHTSEFHDVAINWRVGA
jgi:hypothetical protein